MKNLFFILITIGFSYAGHTQKCTSGDDLLKIPGAWKQTETGEVAQTAQEVAREKLILNDIQQVVRNNFTWAPFGGDIFYSSHFPSRWTTLPVAKICNVYEWEMHFLDFLCIEGKIKHNETATWFYVDVNKTPFEFKESFFVSRLSKEGSRIYEDPETDVYAYLPEIPDAKGRWYDYNEDGFSGGGGTMEYHRGSSYRVLHKKDALPFIAMPKKEYYEKWKTFYQQQMKQKELVIDAMSAEYKKIGGGSKMIDDAKKLARADEIFINRIDAILRATSAETLSLPAIWGEELGELYDNAIAKQYKRAFVVKPNLAYYNQKLSKSSPQVITLHFSYAYTVNRQKNEKIYSEAGFVTELQRINLMNLLADKLQNIITQ